MKMAPIARCTLSFLCVALPLFTVPAAAQPVKQAAPIAGRAPDVGKLLPPDIGVQSAHIDWANSRVVIVVARTANLPPEIKGTRVFTDIWGPWMRTRPLESPGPGEAVVTTGGPNPFQYHKHGEQDIRFDGRLTYTIYEQFSSAINKILEVKVAVLDIPNGTNAANDRLTLAGGERPPRPAAVPVYITSFTAAPSGGHVRLTIKITNPRSETLRNLRLVLIKSHLALHEWKPLGLASHAGAQVHWDDAMPDPGATVRYEAILTTDMDTLLPPLDSILDRRQLSYRRGTTVIGTP